MAGFFSNMMSDFTKFVGQDDMSKKIRGIENKIKDLKQKENAFYFSIGKQAIEKYGYDEFGSDGKTLLQILEDIKVSEKELEDAKAEKVKVEAEEKARREAEKAAASAASINTAVTPQVVKSNVEVQTANTPSVSTQENSNSVVTFNETSNVNVAQESVVHVETETQNINANENVVNTEIGESAAQVNNVAIRCQNCGEAYDKEFAFCQKCGTKMEKIVLSKKFCSDCGAETDETSKFCARCGRQF